MKKVLLVDDEPVLLSMVSATLGDDERFQVFLAVALLVLVAMELIPERVSSWLVRRNRAAGAA